tara:strand:+ start:27430 stop:27852 length:423 start_codon:yes stop_codon:yes gene_type:complete
MKRTVIGSLFGQIGAYISQPGDDLDNPQKSLLLDSRFSETLNVHFAERVRLNTSFAGTNVQRYWIIRNFPSVGLTPQYYTGLVLYSSGTVTYPNGAMMVRTRTVQRLELNVTHDTYDIDMEINGNAMDLDVFYVIYRNAR